jgi:PAB-dependent poly(A)-specific ribonuclease subunit 2
MVFKAHSAHSPTYRFYNKTNYSGLETHISNSYTNSLLQALHYTLPVRIVAKAHIAQDCQKEACLLCEAGFLFRMLEDAKGINCQASNFSRAFSGSAQGMPIRYRSGNSSDAKFQLACSACSSRKTIRKRSTTRA